ncbi:MAG TPA: Ni/Fe hydrogenase subunit alpha [Euzebyales bacterium]|nr:Ni/Fe hydrogenase subunit alpha [Euzebyales bacterium]
MHNNVVIDPVTRIEGHAKITLRLDDTGTVDDARFHVTEFRGFEDFCRGRPVFEMPSLTARTCGICPVSHLLASAKAGDAILGVSIPPAAVAQRRLANLGQIIQSHALSYFHLSAPDLLLGMDADPAGRNLFGLMAGEPELARRGIRLRKFGQQVIAAVTGERVHGSWIVPGGVAHPLSPEARDAIAALAGEARQAAADTIDEFTGLLARFAREVAVFGAFDSLFLAHCAADGTWDHYGGGLRVVDGAGDIVVDGLDPARYREVIGEWGSADSYLKSPYWKALAAPDDPSPGMYRVGPLARLNVCERFGVPLADEALAGFRERAGGIARSSFYYHYARLIEVLACVELIERALDDPVLIDPHVRATAGINARHAVGASEAPRGTLFHDYTVDDDGLITAVNMVIATGQNNLAMNRTVLQIAREFVHGADVTEGALNRVEAGIRAFDPCLSCSTHALGEMPMLVEITDHTGTVIAMARRD